LHALDRARVVSRQSSFAYKHRNVDARTIARELGCRYVVEGSVRKLGDRMRVTAQLIDAPTDRHLWAERYDRRLEDAFQLQDEICDAVVAAIESKVEPPTTGAASAAAGTTPSTKPMRLLVSGRWTIPVVLALVSMAALLTFTLQRQGEEREAREETLPRLQALIQQDDYAAAFELASEIERVTPNDPVLQSLRPSFSAAVKLNTSPQGAKVFYRPYASTEQDWRLVGETPLVDVSVPIGVGLWRIEKEGSAPALLAMRNPGVQLGNDPFPDITELFKDVDFTIPLADPATSPQDMVFVPAVSTEIRQISSDFIELPAFFLDRFEVSNRDFKAFVDAAAYAEAAYWQDLPFDSASGDWRSAVGQFVDLTGRPGPAPWQAGTYPDGMADHPVTGISWFEAAAYCRFRGKELPTAYHWYRASSSVFEYWESLASVIVNSSNFSGQALEPVGRLGSLGPFGTYDMAGNAREWLWTEGAEGRLIVGGAYNDPPYLYSQPEEAPPNDRSAANGVRCMRTVGGGPASAKLREPIVSTPVDYTAFEPIGDAAYSVLAQQLAYRPERFTPRTAAASSSNSAWTKERIDIPTGYDSDTFAVQLFLPTAFEPPYQLVVYGPHGGDFGSPVTTDDFEPASGGIRYDFLLKSGRALAVIALDGAFERRWSAERRRTMGSEELARLWQRHWRQELGRTIDYLETRQDIDAGRLGWFGVSMGADFLVPLLALEKRIGAAVLYSGGGGGFVSWLPVSERPFNYYPRVTQPVLMLNGRWDIDSPIASQERMLELLGAPADQKKHVLFESGHGNLPRFQVERATLDWFDRYLGPVSPGR
jgi:pimeloyl-ACP methyl ester carboxylesterase